MVMGAGGAALMHLLLLLPAAVGYIGWCCTAAVLVEQNAESAGGVLQEGGM